MKRAFQIALSVALSVLFVWLSVRGVALGEIAGAIAGADPLYIGLYVLAWTAVHVVRVQRWGQLLAPLTRARFRDVHPIASVGFLALMVLPFRLGEFARPALASDRLGVRASAAMASVVVERVVDGLYLGLGLVLLLWGLTGIVPEERVGSLRFGGLVISAGFGAGLVLLIAAYRYRNAAVRLLHAVVGRVSPKLATKLADMLEAFCAGLDVVPNTRSLLVFFASTTLYWGLCAAGIAVLAPAFGLHLDGWEACTVLAVAVIGAMIPGPPGMVGTMQLFTVMGLKLFVGPEHDVAMVAYAHTMWAIQFVHQVGMGLWFLGTGQVPLGALLLRAGRNPSPTPESAPLAAAPSQSP